jgi:hypothetical protein
MGSTPNSAQKEAQQAEAERQAKITQSVGAINGVFSAPARQKQYADFLKASRDLYGNDLNRQQTEASRNLKFSLARSGNIGGSLQADQGRHLGEDYNRGVIEAERRAQGDEAALRGQDQQSRLNLLAMAQSGLDANTGANQAAEAMRNSLQSGAAARNVQGLGNIFSGFADVFKRSREEAQRRKELQYVYSSLYGNPNGPPGG